MAKRKTETDGMRVKLTMTPEAAAAVKQMYHKGELADVGVTNLTEISPEVAKGAIESLPSETPVRYDLSPRTPSEGEGHDSATRTEFELPEQTSQNATSRAAAADPFGIQTINLSDENDGPKMRLLRANKFQQMQIQFDEKPDETIRARLNSDGWKWRNVEKVWTKQLDPDARWRTHADAERLFKDIGDAIRAEQGLSPTGESAR